MHRHFTGNRINERKRKTIPLLEFDGKQNKARMVGAGLARVNLIKLIDEESDWS